MKDLDNKLKNITVFQSSGDCKILWVKLDDRAIAQIKKAFADAEYMTGQEWYDRFEQERRSLISRGDGETWMGWGCGDVIRVARRAAGIE